MVIGDQFIEYWDRIKCEIESTLAPPSHYSDDQSETISFLRRKIKKKVFKLFFFNF